MASYDRREVPGLAATLWEDREATEFVDIVINVKLFRESKINL